MKPFQLYRPLVLILFVLATCNAAAQDDASTKFIDSLKTPPPAVRDTIVRDEAVTDSVSTEVTVSGTEVLPDTAITSNNRKISTDTLYHLKKDKGFYYQHWLDSLLRADEANMSKDKPKEEMDLSALNTFFTIFKIFLWLLATAVLVFIIYKLFLGKNALFISNRKNIASVIASGEEAPEDQYAELIKKAEAKEDYRLAVRYRYLQALADLSEKEYIRRGTEKTNYQYIAELRKRSAKAASLFSALTVKYEYSWYGEYPVSGALYKLMETNFNEFYKELV